MFITTILHRMVYNIYWLIPYTTEMFTHIMIKTLFMINIAIYDYTLIIQNLKFDDNKCIV